MVAMEFVQPGVGDGRVPDADLTKRVIGEALERAADRPVGRVLRERHRIIPPLVTTAAEVDLALSILEDSLAAAGA